MNKVYAGESGALHIKVFKEIERAILDGDFPPGYNLTEQKLSTELGIMLTM